MLVKLIINGSKITLLWNDAIIKSEGSLVYCHMNWYLEVVVNDNKYLYEIQFKVKDGELFFNGFKIENKYLELSKDYLKIKINVA
jgi:hypothetical protein